MRNFAKMFSLGFASDKTGWRRDISVKLPEVARRLPAMEKLGASMSARGRRSVSSATLSFTRVTSAYDVP